MDGRDQPLGRASWLRDDVIDAIAARAGIGTVRSVSRAPGGSGDSTVVVESDEGKWVVRVATIPSDTGQLVREQRAAAVFADRVPEVAWPWPYHVDDACDLAPEPYAVARFVAGEVLAFARLTTEHVIAMAELLGTIHARCVPAHRSDGEAIALATVARAQWIDEPTRDSLSASVRDVEWRPSVLLHGDYAPANVAFGSDGRVAGLFDLQSARLGDPRQDAVRHLWWSTLNGRPDLVAPFARAYDRHQGLGGPALRTLLLLDLLDVWEIGQELQQPWFNSSDFYEWADPLAADAVVRTQAALHEK